MKNTRECLEEVRSAHGKKRKCSGSSECRAKSRKSDHHKHQGDERKYNEGLLTQRKVEKRCCQISKPVLVDFEFFMTDVAGLIRTKSLIRQNLHFISTLKAPLLLKVFIPRGDESKPVDMRKLQLLRIFAQLLTYLAKVDAYSMVIADG